MTDKEQHDMFNEVFTRLRETEKTSSNLCIKLDNVISQMKTSATVTDKFIEMLEKRRLADEAREAKFWKAIAVLGGALVVLALGKEPAKILIEHFTGSAGKVASYTDIVPMAYDRHGWRFV